MKVEKQSGVENSSSNSNETRGSSEKRCDEEDWSKDGDWEVRHSNDRDSYESDSSDKCKKELQLHLEVEQEQLHEVEEKMLQCCRATFDMGFSTVASGKTMHEAIQDLLYGNTSM